MTDTVASKPHLSASSIGMFLKCPRQYEFRYMQKIKSPPNAAMTQGSVVHKAVETNFRQKIETGVDLPLDSVKDACADAHKDMFTKDVILGEGDTIGKLKDQAVSLVEIHHKEIAPRVQPAAVEQKFNLDLGEEFPFTLLGFIDLVEKDGTIADLKVKGKRVSQADLDEDMQFTCYSLARRIITGEAEPGMRMDILLKNKIPKAVQMTTTRTNADCRFFLGQVEQVGNAIKTGIFYPNTNGWHCSENWCGYWDMCKGAR